MPAILGFIRDLAEYEKELKQVVATEADLLRDGFGEDPKYFCLMADQDGSPAGMAFCFHTYSTWVGRWGIYLEDLYVRPQMRGRGIGRALLVEVARIAVREKCGRVNWQVLDWNKPAIRLYDRLGAKQMKQWIVCRLEGKAVDRLARS